MFRKCAKQIKQTLTKELLPNFILLQRHRVGKIPKDLLKDYPETEKKRGKMYFLLYFPNRLLH